MTKFKIKVGDKVRVTKGTSRDSEGTVTKILRDKNKAIVEGVNMVSKHEKPSASNPQGGIKKQEAPVHISNLSLIDSEGKATKVGYRNDGDKKVRYAKTNNEAI